MNGLVAIAMIVCGCSLRRAPAIEHGAASDAGARAGDGIGAGPSSYVNTTLCPDEGASLGCCYGDNICGIELNQVCYPRAALVLDARGCDGGAPGPFAHSAIDTSGGADGGG